MRLILGERDAFLPAHSVDFAEALRNAGYDAEPTLSDWRHEVPVELTVE